MTLRQAHKELTRSRIVNAARQCFYAKGYADTSMEEIAATAGVQRTTMYAHFNSKHALLVHLFASNVDHIVSIYARLARAPVIDRKVLHAWLADYIRNIREYLAASRLFYLTIATDETVEKLLDGQRLKIIEMLGERFPSLDTKGGDEEAERRTIKGHLAIIRVNQFVASAARDAPIFLLPVASDIIVDELMALLAPGA